MNMLTKVPNISNQIMTLILQERDTGFHGRAWDSLPKDFLHVSKQFCCHFLFLLLALYDQDCRSYFSPQVLNIIEEIER